MLQISVCVCSRHGKTSLRRNIVCTVLALSNEAPRGRQGSLLTHLCPPRAASNLETNYLETISDLSTNKPDANRTLAKADNHGEGDNLTRSGTEGRAAYGKTNKHGLGKHTYARGPRCWVPSTDNCFQFLICIFISTQLARLISTLSMLLH